VAEQPEIEAKLRRAVDALPKGLRDHVLRVEVEAIRLAGKHNVDVDRARIAALGHDLVRHKRGDELLGLAAQYGLAPDEVERAEPILVHGPVAARMLVADYKLTDVEIVAAIDCHTTARADMAVLEKVLFLADKIEPQKLETRPQWREVCALADADLDQALLRFLNLHFEEAVERAWLLHPRSVEARNQLLRAKHST
jgi:predicted HD superfamily hydrolase involved in NAD metabolism